MEQTPNYALSQWDEQDRILREDFNANNAKVEQALAEQAEQLAPIAAQISKLGNCQLYTTTYTGTGKVAVITQTFPHKPIVVMVNSSDGKGKAIFSNGMPQVTLMHNISNPLTLTWNGNSASWYFNGSTETGLNESGKTYYVAALLDMSAE